MSNKQKILGKVTIASNLQELQVNFSQSFNETPSIKITGNNSFNVYMSDVTKDNFKLNKAVEEEITVNYIAIEGDADDLPANEETIIVSIQADPVDNSIDRFYFNGSYPLTLNAVLGKLYKFDISGIQSHHELQFGFGQGDGHWDPNFKAMGSSSADEFAQGLENSFIDYKQTDQNFVQLRLESPAENGVTITRDMSGQDETVTYFHFWNMWDPDYGGSSVINFGS